MINRHLRYKILFILSFFAINIFAQSEDLIKMNHKKMVSIFHNCALKSDFQKLPDILLNDQAVNYYKKLEKTSTKSDVSYVKVKIAEQLLKSGQTEDAISEIENLISIQTINEGNYKVSVEYLKNLLALSYLRLGEQQNCLLNHSSESCIFPIKGGGIYSIKDPTRKAISILKELYNNNPSEIEKRWLINLAYMNLGEYPDSLDKDFWMPMNFLDNQDSSIKFLDIAPNLGLNLRELSGSAILDDFDNDGDLDLFVNKEGFYGQCKYYTNDREMGFTDKTSEAGLIGEVGGRIPVQADYNNDGFLDIFSVRGAWLTQEDNHLPNSLLKNNGDGTFSNVTIQSGILAFDPSSTAAWCDYNNDGYIDLFVANETSSIDFKHPCQLYHNNGNGTFINVAKETGLDILGVIKGAVWGDYNNDGLYDLYVSDLLGPHKLMMNEGIQKNGHFKFKDVTVFAGVANPQSGLPVLFLDYNNDGLIDIFAPAYSMTGNVPRAIAMQYFGIPSEEKYMCKLYKNSGKGSFTDVSEETGVNKIIYAMGLNFGDINFDGYPDIYAGTGDLQYGTLFPNILLKNDSGKRFFDISSASGTAHLQKGHGISFGDFDNDGDQDIYTVLGGGYSGDVYDNVLFENQGHKNNWVYLNLEGTRSNKSAIGAKIKVTVLTDKNEEKDIYSIVSSGGSFGASCLRREIGLGKAKSITKVEVYWPVSKTNQIFTNVGMYKNYKIIEGANQIIPLKLIKINYSKKNSDNIHH